MLKQLSLVLLTSITISYCDFHTDQLMVDLFHLYNRDVRPVENSSHILNIHFGASLIRIIRVQWKDYKLIWNPDNYGGIRKLHIPAKKIWTPDIVLYNNAHGQPQITIAAEALVFYDGKVVWRPPAIYNSFCEIDIEFFPYDQQICTMKFGGWTYDGLYLDVVMMPVKGEDSIQNLLDSRGNPYQYMDYGMDLSYFYESAEWDLMNLTAARHEQMYPGCCGLDSYIDVTFTITLRRKPLFYTVNLVIPCMLIAILTTCVFWIPAVELKMTFAISLLISLTFFYLLLIELIPPTGLVIPLIGKFLLFTMILVGVSICVTVSTLNLYNRKGNTHRMPEWMRWLFLHKLTKPLLIKQKQIDNDDDEVVVEEEIPEENTDITETQLRKSSTISIRFKSISSLAYTQWRLTELALLRGMNIDVLRRMLANITFISEYFKVQRNINKISEEWCYVSMVLDRLFLITFTLINIIGTIWIIYQAPHLFDTRQPLPKTFPVKPLGAAAGFVKN